MKNIKIQSMTDVITNSSTSVFCIYAEHNINTIKKLVNSILAISGEYTFDDLFEIKLDYNYYAIHEFITDDNYKEMEGLSDNELEKYLDALPKAELKSIIDDFNEFYLWEKYQFYDGLLVKVKSGVNSDKAKQAAKLIGQIDSIFDLDYSE